MKIYAVMLSLALSSSSFALGFAWDYADEDFDYVDGFRVFCGPEKDGTSTNKVWEGKARETGEVTLPNGWQSCNVAAYKGELESGRSNTLRFRAGPLSVPGTLRFQ